MKIDVLSVHFFAHPKREHPLKRLGHRNISHISFFSISGEQCNYMFYNNNTTIETDGTCSVCQRRSIQCLLNPTLGEASSGNYE